MKKKIILIAASIAAVSALAVTGTLMLFTATTETANNVVTIGAGIGNPSEDSGAFLREWGGILDEDLTPPDPTEDTTGWINASGVTSQGGFIPQATPMPVLHQEITAGKTDGTDFKGIDFGDIVLNQQFAKFPDVARDDVGGVPAYVMVKVRAYIEYPQTSGGFVREYQFPERLRGFMANTLASAGVGDNWQFQQVEPVTQTAADGYFTGYYYYINENHDGVNGFTNNTLKVLDAPVNSLVTTSTSNSIFKNNITIFNETDPDVLQALARTRLDSEGNIVDDSFGGCKLGVEITGYLVQTEWNDYNTSGANLFDAFKQLASVNNIFDSAKDSTDLVDPR